MARRLSLWDLAGAMPYWERAPDERLSPFVERLCFSSDEQGTSPPRIRILPDGRIDLLFSVVRAGAPAGVPACRGEVFGTKTRELVVAGEGPADNIAVRFRPGAAPRLLGVSADELTDRAVAIDALWGARGARLAERIGAAGDFAARRACLEAELLGRVGAARFGGAAAAALDRALAGIERARGVANVAEIARRVGLGERRLLRLFRERVGVPPKVFARICRFRSALRLLRGGATQVDAALACGYSDQSHLQRDFRAFAGTSPAAFLRESRRPSDSSKTAA